MMTTCHKQLWNAGRIRPITAVNDRYRPLLSAKNSKWAQYQLPVSQRRTAIGPWDTSMERTHCHFRLRRREHSHQHGVRENPAAHWWLEANAGTAINRDAGCGTRARHHGKSRRRIHVINATRLHSKLDCKPANHREWAKRCVNRSASQCHYATPPSAFHTILLDHGVNWPI